MADRVTRASNATAHPGLVDRNPPRRSKEDVQAEKQARADVRARAEHEKNANILKVAAFERAAKQKAMEVEQAGDDPTTQMSRPRPRMVRPRPEAFDDGPAESPTRKKKRTFGPANSDVEHDDLAEAKLTALLNESGSSESEYMPVDRPESEEDAEGEGGGEEERPAKLVVVKKDVKKKNKGLLTREQIMAAAAAMSDSGLDDLSSIRTSTLFSQASGVGTSQTPGQQATHNASGARSQRHNVKAPQGPFGIKSNWKKTPNTRPMQSPGVFRGAQTSTLEAESDIEPNPTPPRGETTEPDDGPVYSFVSENSGSGRFENSSEKKSSESLKYKSITQIKEVYRDSTPSRVINPDKKRKNVSYDDLPPGTKAVFKTRVIPMILDTTGALKPWVTLDDETIIDIWNIAYDGTEHRIEGSNVDKKTFDVTKILIKRAISTWLHKFADAAEKALVAEFALQGLTDPVKRADLVRFLLGSQDKSDKNRKFIWDSVYHDHAAREEGMFQGRLVARTFLEHLQVISGIDKSQRVKERPVGALILAVQAVHRALLCSKKGTFELPDDKKSAEFSKLNWDDQVAFTQPGDKPRKEKRASVFLRTIKGMGDRQWSDIIDVALSFRESSKKTSRVKVEDPVSETESEEDLVDPRYVVVPEAEAE